MSEWSDTTIGDEFTFQRGFDITRATQKEGSIPVVSSGGVSSFHHEPAALGPGVVIGRKGTLGKVFYLSTDYWPHDTTLWVRDFKGNNPRFVYYFMTGVDVSWLDAGSANPTLNRNHLHPIKIFWPPRQHQVAIAEVLGALDDKIAANTKLAETSLRLATSTFERLSYPLEYGTASFEDVASISGGGTPNTSVPEYWDGEVRWATPTDITALNSPFLESTSRTLTEAGLAACSSKLFGAGAILMTSRATVGAMAITQQPTAVNQGFIVVEPRREAHRNWLFHEMKGRISEFVSWANGATFLELSRGNFKKLKVIDVSEPVLDQFEKIAAPLHRIARTAHQENSNLANIRDTLLPQLMSGKLRVRDAERTVSEVL